jgi:hypothetical protein
VLGIPITKFEGESAEDQGQQHQQDREVDCRDDDGEGYRKDREEPYASEDKPSLVAVPDLRDRVHYQVSGPTVGREMKEHADAEVETIKRDPYYGSLSSKNSGRPCWCPI